MVLKTQRGGVIGESVTDLRSWLTTLPTPMPIQETALLSCPKHEDGEGTWSYVEADKSDGIARRRCLVCATMTYALDSEDRWSFPATWACGGCGHSIAEVAAGFHLPDDQHVSWVVLACRCVECGRLEGLTDMTVANVPLSTVLEHL